jgi:hypothetical protein
VDSPHEPAVRIPAGDANVGLGRDAAKKGGNHLASSLEVKRGQQRPSAAVCAPWEVCVRRFGARKIARKGQKVESYHLRKKRKAGVFADLPQAKAAISTTATTSRSLQEWHPTFIANVSRDGIHLYTRGSLPAPFAA